MAKMNCVVGLEGHPRERALARALKNVSFGWCDGGHIMPVWACLAWTVAAGFPAGLTPGILKTRRGWRVSNTGWTWAPPGHVTRAAARVGIGYEELRDLLAIARGGSTGRATITKEGDEVVLLELNRDVLGRGSVEEFEATGTIPAAT